MATSEPLRLALVGGGGIAYAHAFSAAEIPDAVVVVAACDPRPQGIATIRERYPDIRPHASLDELLETGGFDAAIIGTPHYLHLPQALALVERGIPVLIEKPVTCTTAELRQLAEASERTGAFVLPGQTRRFIPDMRWIRARIASDPTLIGDVTSFAITSLQDVRSYTRGDPNHWILDAHLAGGGVVISLAVHQIDLVRYLTGEDYTRVSASAQYDAPFRGGAESAMSAMLELTNGAAGTMQASYVATRAPYEENLNIIGRHGSIAQHVAMPPAERGGSLLVSSAQGSTEISHPAVYGGWEGVQAPAGLEGLHANSMTNEQAHFAEVVRGEAEPVITLESNFNTIAAIEALMVSARERREVEVETW